MADLSCCDCCCEYVDIFRCEQLAYPASGTAALWSASQTLAYVLCDTSPSPARIEVVAAWTQKGEAGSAAGGSMDLLMDASAIKVTGQHVVQSFGTHYVEVGLFDNATVARFEVDVVDADQWVYGYFPERIVLDGLTRSVVRQHFAGDVLSPNEIEIVSAAVDGGGAVVTAMTPCFGGLLSAGDTSGNGEFAYLLIDRLAGYGTSQAIGGFTNSAPVSFRGNECSTLTVYRDGDLVGTIEQQASGLSLAKSALSANVSLSGDGTAASPFAGFISDSKTFEAGPGNQSFTLTASGAGLMRLRAKLGRWQSITTSVVATFTNDRSAENGGSIIDRYYTVTAKQAITVTVGTSSPQMDTGVGFAPYDLSTELGPIFIIPSLFGRFELTETQKALFSNQGSYLVIGSHGEPGELARDNSTLRLSRDYTSIYSAKAAQPLHCFTSLVVLTEPPSVAVRQSNDIYFTGSTRTVSLSFGEVHFENPYPQILSNRSLSAPIVDVAGNAAFSVSPVTYTVHEIPSDEKRGASSSFIPFAGTASLIFQESIGWIDLVFDRPVSGVNAGMVSIVRQSPPSGASQTFSPVEFARRNGEMSAYRITLPTQDFNTQWKITFAPTTAVGTWPAGTRLESYSSQDAFPPLGIAGIVYEDESSGSEYVWDDVTEAYRVTQSTDYEEHGTTRLAARFMWAIGKDKSIGRYVDDTTCTAPAWVTKRASLTSTMSASTVSASVPIDRKAKSRIASSNDMWLPPKAGQFRASLPAVGLETFVPRMPYDQDSHTETDAVSYYGLTTTIYPAAPSRICECAAPSEAQIHASLMFGEQTISAITAKLKKAGAEFFWGGLNFPYVFNLIPGPSPDNTPSLKYSTPVPFTERVVDYSMRCPSSSSSLPQNMWFGSFSPNLATTKSLYTNLLNIGKFIGTVVATINTIDCRIEAFRGFQTYTEKQTTTASQLRLSLEMSASVSYVSDQGSTITASRRSFCVLLLTKQQERSLVAGGPVDVEDTTGSVWTLSSEA